MKKKILCATDFSAPAARMADAAATLAARSGDTLVLAHVLETPAAANESLSQSLAAAAKDRLHDEAARLRQIGAEVEEELVEGSPAESLGALIERLSVRLAILASHKKRSVAERWLFGGVVERVVKSATIPCLVIRDASFLEEWLSGKAPLRIFVAADLSSTPDAPLRWVKEITRLGPCQINVAYVNWVPDEAVRLGISSTTAFFEGSRQLQSMLEKELREKVGRILEDVPVTINVEPRWGRADLPLIGMAELSHTDLFVVGTRRRGSFSRLFDESVSLGILHHAPMAVATVPLLDSAVEAPLPSFDRVLVPTDFSECANHAIPYACSLAAPGGTVCLAHVSGRFCPDEKEAGEQLTALIPPQAAGRGIRCETAVWSGQSEAEGIGHLAARFRADAICIGSHGRSGISRALLGSVAQAVLASSKCPVLIVRKPA